MGVKEYSQLLISKGIYPGKKQYSHVRPRGLNKLIPSVWKTAKQLEQAEDISYDILMNQYRIAHGRIHLENLKKIQEISKGAK